MTIVDVHSHFYPPEYLEAVRTGPSDLTVRTDEEGNPVLGYTGDYNVVVRGHRDIAYRASVLDAAGVDLQVLTFTAPGTLIETPARSAQLASGVNDALARIATERSDRFTALATLPLNNPAAAVLELRRAVEELRLPGAMLFGNVNGTGLDDPRFGPLYEAANEYGVVLYIHPTQAIGAESMLEYWLMPLIGFTYDTTLAAARIVFGGVVERFPRIRWILAHLGGTIPFLAERLDRGFEAFEECRRHISRPPSEYLKRLYYDTVNFDPGALRLALEFVGPEQLLAGSDYAHKIGSLSKMVEAVEALSLSDEAKRKILGENAVALLGLDVGDRAETQGSNV